jgi:hypothetical protein
LRASLTTGLEQGKYTLKDQCWKELDPYFLTWDRTQLQRAEERFFRATGKSAPSTFLPKWTNPFTPLSGLARIPTSGVVHDVLVGVLREAEAGGAARVPENVLYAALHLLALALDTCEKGGSGSRQPFVLKAAEGLSGGFGEGGFRSAGDRPGLVELLVRLRGRFLQEREGGPAAKSGAPPEKEAAGMVEGFLKRLAAMDDSIRGGIQRLDPGLLAGGGAAQPSEKGPMSEAEKRKLQAKSRQAAVMARMKAAQAQFAASVEGGENEPEEEPVHAKGEGATCALCREPAGGADDSPICHVILAQRSKVVAWARRKLPDWREGIYTESGPEPPGGYSRLGPLGGPNEAGVQSGEVMGPGGHTVALEAGAQGGAGVVFVGDGLIAGFTQDLDELLAGWEEGGVIVEPPDAEGQEEDEEESEDWNMEEEEQEFDTIGGGVLLLARFGESLLRVCWKLLVV